MSGGCEILRLWQEVFRAIINRAGNFSPNSITSLKLCPSASLMSSVELSLESSSGREKENPKNLFSVYSRGTGSNEKTVWKAGCVLFTVHEQRKWDYNWASVFCQYKWGYRFGEHRFKNTKLQSSHFLVSPPLSLLYHPVPCHPFPKLENQFHFAHVCFSLILVLPKQEALQQLTRPLWSLFSTWVSFSHKWKLH